MKGLLIMLALGTVGLGVAACEFNRDGRHCEPRVPAGGSCSFGLTGGGLAPLGGAAEDQAPAGAIAPFPREPVVETSPTDPGCESGSACASFSLTCQTMPGPGEPCLDGSLCASPSICDFSTSRCSATGQDGDPCPFGFCAPGHRCIENTCIASELFSPCASHGECPADHFCELAGTRSCLLQVDLGETCASSAACRAPNICSGEGVCVAPLSEGDDCTDACGPGLFCTFNRSNTNDPGNDVPIAIPAGRPALGGTLSGG